MTNEQFLNVSMLKENGGVKIEVEIGTADNRIITAMLVLAASRDERLKHLIKMAAGVIRANEANASPQQN